MSSSTLNSNEVDALMEAINEGNIPSGGDDGEAEVVPYDLTSQDRIIRGQMPTLDAINDRIASLFVSGLSGRTRVPVEISASPATLMKFADFNVLLAPPATVGVIDLGSGHGNAVLVLAPGLAEALLAAALGDRKARPEVVDSEGRWDLTQVDRLVLKNLLSGFLEAMKKAWSEVLQLSPSLRSFESDPRLAMVAAPNDVAILCTFSLEGAIQGNLQLGLPYSAVEPAKKVLTSPMQPGATANARFSEELSQQLLHVDVELRAELGRQVCTLGRFLELGEGDVIALDSDEDDALRIYVQDRPRLRGHPRTQKSSLAVVLTESLFPSTRIDTDSHDSAPAADHPEPDAAVEDPSDA